MGDKKVRRAKFFAENSHRCFCGGEALATTEDHIPSRSILDARQWPEGYRFPACAACNRVTPSDEVVIAMRQWRIRRKRNHGNALAVA
jgi:hypothetical protein